MTDSIFGAALIGLAFGLVAGFRMGRKIERIEAERDRYIAPKGQLYHLRAESSGHPSVWRRDGHSR